jgi:CheY-like chemotaxis protein
MKDRPRERREPLPPGRSDAVFDPGLLLARLEGDFRSATKGSENRLQVVVNPDLPRSLFGDKTCLQSILAHLVNSLSRCVEGATIEVSTTIHTRDPRGVSVSFGFNLIEGPTTVVFTDERGAADLETAQALAKAMGGEVIGPRVEGVGTMIQFSKVFPRSGSPGETGKPTESEAGRILKEPHSCEHISNRARRVLLAEDNRVTQAVTRKILQRRGHEVCVVGNGREAVEKVRERSFDVVLMDLEMPEMDGLTATQLIRALPSLGPPIVAYTAFTQPENRRQCKQAGVDEILAKPVSCHELFHEVERWPRRIDP